MLTIVVVTFLAIQSAALLLLVGSCIAGARTDLKAVRPYVPQRIEYSPAVARRSVEFSAPVAKGLPKLS